MARRGALTALQAVLAGVSGGAQGLVQQREMERKRQQEQADREEQQAMNVASLYERGFMTPEQFAKKQDELKATEPAQRLTLGGQEYVRPRTPEEAAMRREMLRDTLAQKGKAQESKQASSALASVLGQYGEQIRLEDRPAVMTGAMTLTQALERAQGRQPAPVDPMVARQRQSLLESRTAQSYVEAAQGDAARAYADYKSQNPTAPIPEREFKSAAYRIRNRMSGNADAIQMLIDNLVSGNRPTP